MGNIEYNAIDFSASLESSFIDSNKKADDRYAPKILSNNDSTCNVLSVLKKEFANCTSFDLSVAFITSSGIQVLAGILAELSSKNIPGRILTSTYLSFNEPDALRKILEYPNIEARIYQGSLHAKGYFFDQDGISTIIIGSSNLTQTALTCNKEWNILFRSFPNGEILHQTKEEFLRLWNDDLTTPITKTWVDNYEVYLDCLPKTCSRYALEQNQRGFAIKDSDTTSKIRPNKMQSQALEALSVLHKRNEPRALLVSATGTGKTYLSALEIEKVKPKKVLFVAHRQRILDASQKSFNNVLGDTYTYGQFINPKERSASCLFAMVVSLSGHLTNFSPEEFDYIIIDEAHRTGAKSYQKILEYFKPKFVLGMTATPTRTDGYNVYELFNHVIAYRITLQDALENEMLVPFHYYGIADLNIDNKEADDFSAFSQLTSEARVGHITRKIEEYSVRKKDRKGLIFCSRNEEAKTLSTMFNEKGYKTLSISGESTDAERDEAIRKIEAEEIEYIFSVDIFNEGIDIPSINQIIMLRKTESAIVFVQQLGRGLRKDPSKDYTLVLDFIGNYQQNYLIPIALTGDRTYNKDNLRKVVKEGSSVIPGCSTVSFDRIAEKRIFSALEEGKFSSAKLIRSEYEDLRQLLGRIPYLTDFDTNESIDPMLIINKYDSYPAFLMKYEDDCPFAFDKEELEFLKFISVKMANGKRVADLEILRRLVETAAPTELPKANNKRCALENRSVTRMLTGIYPKKGKQLVSENDGISTLSVQFARALQDSWFKACVLDAINFGISRAQKSYSDTYKDTSFVLNMKYTREEVCRFLNWSKEPNCQNIGGYFHDKETNTFPVFVNYEKEPDISITTQYQDRFINDREIICISKSKRTLSSPEIISLSNAENNGMRCFLFLRKNKNDRDNGTEFYFLGEMHPSGEFKQIKMADGKTNAVEIYYDLENPVRPDLYDYFLSSFEE